MSKIKLLKDELKKAKELVINIELQIELLQNKYAFLNEYKDTYEAGKITETEIRNKHKIPLATLTRHITKLQWNRELAKKNRRLIFEENVNNRIRQYRPDYEAGKLNSDKIATLAKTDYIRVSKLIKKENWDNAAMRRNMATISKRPVEILQQIEPLKTKIEHNQFKKLVPKSNIEWNDEIAPEIKIKRKVKEKDFDPIEYANKLIKEREKNSISAQGIDCKRCGMLLPAFGDKTHKCHKR